MKTFLIILLIAILFVPAVCLVMFLYACFCYLTGRLTKDDLQRAAEEYNQKKAEEKLKKKIRRRKSYEYTMNSFYGRPDDLDITITIQKQD
ncbi:MAG: hypothetical protein J5725_12040 [Bacteroidales bacterium]|nr:hypothetical protein [Bacteroidales bacterium]